MKRQFLNLVLGSHKTGSFSLRRIKTALFFHPKKQTVNPAPPAVMEVAQLPEPALSFGVPSAGGMMTMRFMPLGGSADKIVSTDDQGGTVMMYDACENKLHVLPRLTGRIMRRPIPIAAGDALYLIEACPRATEAGQPHSSSFRALIHGDPPDGTASKPGWHWHPLPPPPYLEYSYHGEPSSGVRSRISSWAVVGDSIWVSSHEGVDFRGIYAFDTTTREWKHVRSREIPLLGRADHVPDRDRLFGFRFVSSERNQLFCASGLESETPDTIWEEEAPEQEHHGFELDLAVAPGDWHSHHLAHLGSGRFCTARFYHDDGKRIAVFTGVEVDRGLNLVKHKSLRYNLDDDQPLHWVI
uniref:Uncharacterized protein n=1 Tax=Avena sativa TaxID=4498 RepID=A0ACD5XBG3_AVESA